MEAPERPTSRGSWLGIFLAVTLAMIVTAALALLTMAWFAVVVVIAGGVFGLAAFHYLVWGWWVTKMLHREQESAAPGLTDGKNQDRPVRHS